MNRWVTFRLKVVSLITNYDNSWPTLPNCNRFRWYEQRILFLQSVYYWNVLVNWFGLAELFQRFWYKSSQKISTGLARHHIERFSASDTAASTKKNTKKIGIAMALLKQWLICIQIFASHVNGQSDRSNAREIQALCNSKKNTKRDFYLDVYTILKSDDHHFNIIYLSMSTVRTTR